MLKEEKNTIINELWSLKGLMILLGLILITAGKDFIGSIVGVILNLKFLNKLEFSDVFFQVLVIVLSVFCIWNHLRSLRRRYIYSFIQIYYVILISILYYRFRYTPDTKWVFTPLFGYSAIKLIDVLIYANILFWLIFTISLSRCSRVWYASLDIYRRMISFKMNKLTPSNNHFYYLMKTLILWFCTIQIYNDLWGLDSSVLWCFVGSAIVFSLYLFNVIHFYLLTYFKRSTVTIANIFEEECVFFEEDIPMGNEKNPEFSLSYRKLGKNLAEKLSRQTFQEAFSVGIIGPWGAGKSSFINHVLEVATNERCGSKPIKEIRFFPAFNHSPEQIINDFFSTLIDNLKQYDGRLKSTLLSYSLKLLEASVNKKKDLQTLLSPDNFLMRKRPVYKLYQDLNKIIEKLPIKPIIVIDDLDRLKSDEILEVLRIIRNTANFHNTVFLVALDKEYIRNVISNGDWTNDHSYIEKYFQLEVYLPQNGKLDLKNNFSRLIKRAFTENSDCENIENEKGLTGLCEYIESQDEVVLNYFITSHREVKKLFNQYIQNLSFLDWKVEVDYRDLLHFTLLKANYPSVIYHIYQNWKSFFEIKDGFWRYKMITNEEKSASKSAEIFRSLKSNYKYLNFREDETIKIHKLIIALFGFESSNLPDHVSKTLTKLGDPNHDLRFKYRIHNPNRTDIYFNLLLSDNELPLTMFYSVLYSGSKENFLNFVRQVTKIDKSAELRNEKIIDETRSVLNSLTDKDINDLEDLKKIIECHFLITIKERNIYPILERLIFAKEYKTRGVISDEGKISSFLSDYIFKSFSELNLIELVELYKNIKGNIEVNQDDDYSLVKWGVEESTLPLVWEELVRRFIIDLGKCLDHGPDKLNYGLSDGDILFLFKEIHVSDIQSKRSLEILIRYFVSNFYKGQLEWRDVVILLNSDELVGKNNVVTENELCKFIEIDILGDKRINIKDRLDGFKIIFRKSSPLIIDYLNNGSTNIREQLTEEYLTDKKVSGIEKFRGCAEQMKLKFSKSLLDSFKNILNENEILLREFINYSVVKEQGMIFYIHGYVLNIFKDYSNFVGFLRNCSFSDSLYIKEFVDFYSVYEVFHNKFETEYKAFYKFRYIKPNTRFIEEENVNVKRVDCSIFLYKIKDKELISTLFKDTKGDNPCVSKDGRFLLYNSNAKANWSEYFKFHYFGIRKQLSNLKSNGDVFHYTTIQEKIKQNKLRVEDENYFVGDELILKKYHSCDFLIETV